MNHSLALHIGLNRISPDHYGTDGALAGCVNDANAMQRIARAQGYSTVKLLDEQATAENVLSHVMRAASSLQPGGTFLLTYSGHGAQVDDDSGDEVDGKDETWCLYDRMLIDDELWAALQRFPAGAQVVIVSDSCHSGTVYRTGLSMGFYDAAGTVHRPDGAPRKVRLLPRDNVKKALAHEDTYRGALRLKRRRIGDIAPKVTVLTLSGCQDNQLSADGDVNGLFTERLLYAYGNGIEGHSYDSLMRAVQKSEMPPDQTPKISCVGPQEHDLPKRLAFKPAKPITREYGDWDYEYDRDDDGQTDFIGYDFSDEPVSMDMDGWADHGTDESGSWDESSADNGYDGGDDDRALHARHRGTMQVQSRLLRLLLQQHRSIGLTLQQLRALSRPGSGRPANRVGTRRSA